MVHVDVTAPEPTFGLQLVQHVGGQDALLRAQAAAPRPPRRPRHDALQVLEDAHVGIKPVDVCRQCAEGFLGSCTVSYVEVHVATELCSIDDRADCMAGRGEVQHQHSNCNTRM